jgi:hypothetical protein
VKPLEFLVKKVLPASMHWDEAAEALAAVQAVAGAAAEAIALAEEVHRQRDLLGEFAEQLADRLLGIAAQLGASWEG